MFVHDVVGRRLPHSSVETRACEACMACVLLALFTSPKTSSHIHVCGVPGTGRFLFSGSLSLKGASRDDINEEHH